MIDASFPHGCRHADAPADSDTFTHPVAARAMTVTRNGRTEDLHIEIGQPVQDVETVAGTDWRCPVRWRAANTTRVHNAFGIDSFQALQQAMESIRLQLQALADEEGVRLHFLDCPYDVHTQLPEQDPARAAISRRSRTP